MTDEMVTSTTTEIGEKIGGAVIGGDTGRGEDYRTYCYSILSGLATAVLPVRMWTCERMFCLFPSIG